MFVGPVLVELDLARLVAFLAIVIAGLGNIIGSVFGGLLMGIIQSLTASYLDLDLSTAAI